ncbi:probable steroid 5alpha-reductase [Ustilago sp. UG-2017b]|nr:probable steroid 5alpha-reductase [Ustilago sp. UG-2017b]
MALLTWIKDVIGVGTIPSPPWSPAQLYSVVLASFKSWPFLVPVLSLINAPHGRFAFESLFNINGNFGWFIMEIPSPIFVLLGALSKPLSTSVVKGTTRFLPPMSALFSPCTKQFLALPSANQVLVIMFLIHYTHRAVLQPLRSPKRSPLHISVPLSAVAFNLINGFVMGSWLGGRTPWSALPQPTVASAALTAVSLKAGSTASELARKLVSTGAVDAFGIGAPGLISSSVWKSPLWYLGLAGWAIGFAGNVYHDGILMDIRRPKSQQQSNKNNKADDKANVGKGSAARKYSIPRGGLFEYISFPNYLCEWFEWFSFAFAALYSLPIFAHLSTKDAIATALSTPPFLFPFVLVCLMAPRATNGHAWYKKTFGDKFPKNRKAIIPFLF